MNNHNRAIFRQLKNDLYVTKIDIGILVAKAARDYFLSQFDSQSWEGTHWPDGLYVSNPMLVKTGYLRSTLINSIISDSFNDILLRVDAPYASFHNDGVGILPQRKFFDLSCELEKQLKAIIENELQKMVNRQSSRNMTNITKSTTSLGVAGGTIAKEESKAAKVEERTRIKEEKAAIKKEERAAKKAEKEKTAPIKKTKTTRVEEKKTKGYSQMSEKQAEEEHITKTEIVEARVEEEGGRRQVSEDDFFGDVGDSGYRELTAQEERVSQEYMSKIHEIEASVEKNDREWRERTKNTEKTSKSKPSKYKKRSDMSDEERQIDEDDFFN